MEAKGLELKLIDEIEAYKDGTLKLISNYKITMISDESNVIDDLNLQWYGPDEFIKRALEDAHMLSEEEEDDDDSNGGGNIVIWKQ